MKLPWNRPQADDNENEAVQRRLAKELARARNEPEPIPGSAAAGGGAMPPTPAAPPRGGRLPETDVILSCIAKGEALEAYRIYVRQADASGVTPLNAESLWTLIRLLIDGGRDDQAIDMLKRMLSQFPHVPHAIEAQFELGMLYSRHHETSQQAIIYLKMALSLRPLPAAQAEMDVSPPRPLRAVDREAATSKLAELGVVEKVVRMTKGDGKPSTDVSAQDNRNSRGGEDSDSGGLGPVESDPAIDLGAMFGKPSESNVGLAPDLKKREETAAPKPGRSAPEDLTPIDLLESDEDGDSEASREAGVEARSGLKPARDSAPATGDFHEIEFEPMMPGAPGEGPTAKFPPIEDEVVVLEVADGPETDQEPEAGQRDQAYADDRADAGEIHDVSAIAVGDETPVAFVTEKPASDEQAEREKLRRQAREIEEWSSEVARKKRRSGEMKKKAAPGVSKKAKSPKKKTKRSTSRKSDRKSDRKPDRKSGRKTPGRPSLIVARDFPDKPGTNDAEESNGRRGKRTPASPSRPGPTRTHTASVFFARSTGEDTLAWERVYADREPRFAANLRYSLILPPDRPIKLRRIVEVLRPQFANRAESVLYALNHHHGILALELSAEDAIGLAGRLGDARQDTMLVEHDERLQFGEPLDVIRIREAKGTGRFVTEKQTLDRRWKDIVALSCGAISPEGSGRGRDLISIYFRDPGLHLRIWRNTFRVTSRGDSASTGELMNKLARKLNRRAPKAIQSRAFRHWIGSPEHSPSVTFHNLIEFDHYSMWYVMAHYARAQIFRAAHAHMG